MGDMFTTLLGIAAAAGAAAAGLAKYRQVNRETVASSIEDLARISESKDAVISSLEQDIDRLERRAADMTEQLGRVQGYNEALLREKFLLEQYVAQLIAELRAAGRETPPRRSY